MTVKVIWTHNGLRIKRHTGIRYNKIPFSLARHPEAEENDSAPVEQEFLHTTGRQRVFCNV
jgi:hypothetical protein